LEALVVVVELSGFRDLRFGWNKKYLAETVDQTNKTCVYY